MCLLFRSKVPAKDRYASLSVPSPPSGCVLPTTYQNLLNFFRSSDVVVSMLMNRHEICTFNKLKAGVEEMTKLLVTSFIYSNIMFFNLFIDFK